MFGVKRFRDKYSGKSVEELLDMLEKTIGLIIHKTYKNPVDPGTRDVLYTVARALEIALALLSKCYEREDPMDYSYNEMGGMPY